MSVVDTVLVLHTKCQMPCACTCKHILVFRQKEVSLVISSTSVYLSRGITNSSIFYSDCTLLVYMQKQTNKRRKNNNWMRQTIIPVQKKRFYRVTYHTKVFALVLHSETGGCRRHCENVHMLMHSQNHMHTGLQFLGVN